MKSNAIATRRASGQQSASPESQSQAVGQLALLPLKDIHESVSNPRTAFSAESLQELAASIGARGVLQPILVRSTAKGWEIIAGARRTRAAQLAGLSAIPARVVEMSDSEAREAQIVENLHREDVHALDEAEAYERLVASDPAYTVDTVAAKVGKSATYVYGRMTLLRLIPEVRDAFRKDVITAAHAHKLAAVPPEQQPEAFRRCFFNLLSSGDGQPDRNNLAPMRHLDDWLRTRVALDVHHEDTKRLLPDLADQVSEQEQAGASILALSTLTHHTDTREPKPILARSWKLADGRQKCSFARAGVIVLGEERGRLVQVCIEKKRCRKHWGRPATAAVAQEKAAAQAEADRAARDRARIERERRLWHEHVQPALLTAIAEKSLLQRRMTRPLVAAVLDALTGRQEELTQFCGSLAKLPTDRFAGALLIALALREAFQPDRLIAFAKGLRVDVKRIRKEAMAAQRAVQDEAA